MGTSPYHEYHGYATDDIGADTTVLNVFVPDLLPAATQGTFGSGITTATAKTANAAGVTASSDVTTANHLVMEWWGDRWSSRPPLIRKGEQVKAFHYEDTDKWYWEALGRDRDLRQTDQYRVEISATTDKKSEKNDSNTYTFDVSSDGRYVQIKTSKALGEPFAYCFKIDTQGGTVVLSDDAANSKNRIVLISGQNTIHVNTDSGTTLSLKDKDIIGYAPRDILFHADRQILFDAPTLTLNRDQSGVIIINAAGIALNAATDVVVTAARFGVSAMTKFFGSVISGPMRAVSYAVGALGSAYAAPTSDVSAGTNVPASNSSDTDTSGTGDRHGAAYEQVNQAFVLTAGYIQQICSKIGITIDTSPMTAQASESKMNNILGDPQ